jgi:GT2 family glycosyltransferase
VSNDVEVIVPTFGDKYLWSALVDRAVVSVMRQTVKTKVWRSHEADLSTARNAGAWAAASEWLIFLDADDELDPRYVECMLKGTGDIRQPSTLGIVNGVEDDYPVLIPLKQNLLHGNHLVIGSMVRRSLLLEVGGFRELPILEDWDCWIRLWLAGAEIGTAPDAVYRVHVREGSRNKQGDHMHGRLFTEIQQRYTAEANMKGLT